MIRSYEDLIVYRNSKKLYAVVLRFIRTFPREGQKIGDQILRAASSIHANIAEGYGKSPLEFRRSLRIALGETNEIRSHLEDAATAGYIKQETAAKLIEKYTIVAKQLYRLRESWK